MRRPDVFLFSNYREFLATHVELTRARNPRWSLGVWARQLGLGSSSSIAKILQGRRNPGPELQIKLIEHFQFNAEEEAYFRRLVELAKLSERDLSRVGPWGENLPIERQHLGDVHRLIEQFVGELSKFRSQSESASPIRVQLQLWGDLDES